MASTTEQLKPSPATGEPEAAPKEQEEAACLTPDQLLGEGKKCLAAGDASGAVEAFQEACSILADNHGQISKELAEPYFLYGRSLLELARVDSTVLGSAIPVPGEGSDEEQEMEEGAEDAGEGGDPVPTSSNDVDSSTNEGPPADEAADAKEEGEDPASVTDNEPANTSTVVAKEEGEDPASVTDNEPANTSTEDDLPGTSAEASGETPGNSAPNEEEESDLKLAWEVLELARVICQKEEGDEYKLKLADVNLVLGEVGMESDQYEQAIGDIQSCLQLREFVLEATDRRLAEAHFSLGLAYSFAKQVNSSIAEYKKSKEILEKRITELQSQVKDGTSEDDRKRFEQEITELQELLPDLDAKVADVEELKQVLEEREKEQAEVPADGSATTIGFGEADSNADKETTNDDSGKEPAQDITHLLRKRSAEDMPENTKKAKRPCLKEDGENADTNSSAAAEKLNGTSLETTTGVVTTAEQ